MTEIRSVLAIPAGEDYMGETEYVGISDTLAEALILVREEGYSIIEEGKGGSYDQYDTDDATGIFGDIAKGRGIICITVEP
jgi:hypothetical protein